MNVPNKLPKLDRTAFRMSKHEDLPNDFTYWQSKSLAERLRAAHYLNSVAFQFDVEEPPRLERTIFSMRKHRL